ncbi:hypothetical protein N7447_003746 [Penicillium robsamsonii]|uniref:uncharacterized protein n=1 Tax=Penicillium robsamsonii TaxID=1792511 RepID=UPI00254830A0|nr:uncharacterized protein N7447_003746 [Penicillium robsamsonii]KAJ5826983.1 hypothetical protein N7447_003746 [Penicillium robsamsonii]
MENNSWFRQYNIVDLIDEPGLESAQGTISNPPEILIYRDEAEIKPALISDGVGWSQTGLALNGSRYARNPVQEGLDEALDG